MNRYYTNGGYDMNRYQKQNDYSYTRQSQYENWDNEENYGWNYYPQIDDKYSHSDCDCNKYDFDEKDDKNCKQYRLEKNECKTMCNCNHGFRSCFPFFCFKNCRHNDCRHNRPNNDFCNCRNDWDGNKNCKCPCNDFDYKKPEYDCDKGNRFYFSGCIEFKNKK